MNVISSCVIPPCRRPDFNSNNNSLSHFTQQQQQIMNPNANMMWTLSLKGRGVRSGVATFMFCYMGVGLILNCYSGNCVVSLALCLLGIGIWEITIIYTIL